MISLALSILSAAYVQRVSGQCVSDAKLDILFNIDVSSSIGLSGWDIKKNFTRTLATQGISDSARIGFYLFSTDVNKSRDLQFWESQDLETYVEGLYLTRGWTNTPEVIQASIDHFNQTFDDEREQVLVLITDGEPCVRSACPADVCYLEEQLKKTGVYIEPHK